MADQDDWLPIAMAPEREVIETKIDDADGVRNVQYLVLHGRLWCTPSLSIYVYYTPTHWRRSTWTLRLAGRATP